MAENEVKIKVTTETDTSNLEELENLLDGSKSKAEELRDSFQEATSEVERLEDALAEAHINGDDIQADIIADELYEATQRAEELEAALEEVDSASVAPEVDDGSVDDAVSKAEELGDDLDELDGKTVAPEVDSSGLDELSEKTQEASSSMDSLMTAAAGIGVTAGVEQMVTTADRINTSWNQLELTFGSVTDKMKSDISSAASVTGRSGGEIRGYFNQMGIAGVTNTDLLTASFEALSGKAYQTGNSIDSMETKLQRMVMTGNASGMMLQKLGIDTQDLAKVMGVSADQVREAFKNMTPEERLQAITQAMGDGAKANDMYKDSYQGLKAQADAAMAGLMGAVGQAILPVVIPALQAATNFVKLLTDGFKSLPGPVQAVVGGVLGFAGVALTVVGVLGTMGQMFSMVKGGLEALNIVSGLAKVATYAQAAAQWALNIAMSMNPIGILVIAIVALIAILGYLYFTNEDVRNAINGLGESFMMVGQIIYDTVMWAVDAAITALQGLWDYIVTLGGFLPSSVSITGNQIVDTILRVMAFVATLPIQLAVIFVNAIAQVLGFGNNFVQRMYSSAVNSVTRFMNQIRSLPSKLQAELNNMLSLVGRWASTLPAKFWEAGVNAVKNFLNALGIHSPGTMQTMMLWEVSEMGRRVPIEAKSLITNVSKMGGDVVDAFNPDLGGVNLGGVSGAGAGGVGNTYNINLTVGSVDKRERVEEIIDTIRDYLEWDNARAGRTV